MLDEEKVREIKEFLSGDTIDDPEDLFEDLDIIVELCDFWLKHHED